MVNGRPTPVGPPVRFVMGPLMGLPGAHHGGRAAHKRTGDQRARPRERTVLHCGGEHRSRRCGAPGDSSVVLGDVLRLDALHEGCRPTEATILAPDLPGCD